MRTVIACILALAWATCAWTLGYDDLFDLPDGSFPSEWVWTGDPGGGGSFLVYDGALTHVGGGYAYYVRLVRRAREDLGAFYYLRVLGSHWAFAWRISSDPAAGQCMYLSHDDLSGEWAYTFAEVNWATLDPGEYPWGRYMWHNWTAARTVRHVTPGPLVGWHIIEIDDWRATHVNISVDGELIFSEDHADMEDAFQGVGCVADGTMTPAFDCVIANWPDPVQSGSWGRIKALYR